jgi:hypothetical protein
MGAILDDGSAWVAGKSALTTQPSLLCCELMPHQHVYADFIRGGQEMNNLTSLLSKPSIGHLFLQYHDLIKGGAL